MYHQDSLLFFVYFFSRMFSKRPLAEVFHQIKEEQKYSSLMEVFHYVKEKYYNNTLRYHIDYEDAETQILTVYYDVRKVYDGPSRDIRGETIAWLKKTDQIILIRPSFPLFGDFTDWKRDKAAVDVEKLEGDCKALKVPKYDGEMVKILFIPKTHVLYSLFDSFECSISLQYGVLIIGSNYCLFAQRTTAKNFREAIYGTYNDEKMDETRKEDQQQKQDQKEVENKNVLLNKKAYEFPFILPQSMLSVWNQVFDEHIEFRNRPVCFAFESTIPPKGPDSLGGLTVYYEKARLFYLGVTYYTENVVRKHWIPNDHTRSAYLDALLQQPCPPREQRQIGEWFQASNIPALLSKIEETMKQDRTYLLTSSEPLQKVEPEGAVIFLYYKDELILVFKWKHDFYYIGHHPESKANQAKAEELKLPEYALLTRHLIKLRNSEPAHNQLPKIQSLLLPLLQTSSAEESWKQLGDIETKIQSLHPYFSEFALEKKRVNQLWYIFHKNEKEGVEAVMNCIMKYLKLNK